MKLTKKQIENAEIRTIKVLNDSYTVKFSVNDDTVLLKSKEAASENLTAALQELAPYAVDCVGVSPGESKKLTNRATVKGVHYKHTGLAYQAQVVMEIENLNGQKIGYNTPMMPVEIDEAEYDSMAEAPATWSEEAYDIFESLIDAAKAFLAGERSQTKLIPEENDEEEGTDGSLSKEETAETAEAF